MQLAVANPARLAAVLGVTAALGAGLFVMKTTTGGGSSTATSSEPKLLHTSARHRVHGTTTHRATPRHTAKPHPRPVHRPAVAANGLPRAVADALVRNPVVVVSVVAPQGSVDAMAVQEAKAGAAAANAGFVRIDAFSQAQIAPLQAKLGIKDNPALVVLRRPDTVSFEVTGFVDRATVVQAVADARAAS